MAEITREKVQMEVVEKLEKRRNNSKSKISGKKLFKICKEGVVCVNGPDRDYFFRTLFFLLAGVALFSLFV